MSASPDTLDKRCTDSGVESGTLWSEGEGNAERLTIKMQSATKLHLHEHRCRKRKAAEEPRGMFAALRFSWLFMLWARVGYETCQQKDFHERAAAPPWEILLLFPWALITVCSATILPSVPASAHNVPGATGEAGVHLLYHAVVFPFSAIRRCPSQSRRRRRIRMRGGYNDWPGLLCKRNVGAVFW